MSQSVINGMQKASFLLNRSQANIAEELFQKFLETLDLSERLELRQAKGHNILVKVCGKITDILDVTDKNGVPPQAIAEKYSTMFKTPVTVVEPPSGDGGGTHEDARQDHAS